MRATIHIRRGRVRPLWAGHPWVFDGAIAKVDGSPGAGDEVRVVDPGGTFLGWGFHNPESAIRVRLHSRSESAPWGPELLDARFGAAAAHRAALPDLEPGTDVLRLFNGEGDGISGLTVDRLADHLVVRVHARGVAERIADVLDALERVLEPAGIVGRPDPALVRREGIDATRVEGVLRGNKPDDVVWVREGSVRYATDPLHGQKTGFYADQRANRAMVASLSAGRSVLDLYSYTGGFALACAHAGASSVDAVESGARAIELLELAAERNGVAIGARRAKVGDALAEMSAEGRRFDVVVADPPKLARTRAQAAAALRTYGRLLTAALPCVAPAGLLALFSCAAHVDGAALERELAVATRRAGRGCRVLRRLEAAADHPVHPACPEGRYLRGLLARVD